MAINWQPDGKVGHELSEANSLAAKTNGLGLQLQRGSMGAEATGEVALGKQVAIISEEDTEVPPIFQIAEERAPVNA